MPAARTNIALAVLILADLALAVVFFMLYSALGANVAKTIATEGKIKTVIQKEEATTIMKDQLASAAAYERDLSQYVVATSGAADFITAIDALAKQSGVKSQINSVAYEASPAASAAGDEYTRVSMSVIGDWQSVQFFLTLLEVSPFKIDEKSVSLSTFNTYQIAGKSVPQWSGSIEFDALTAAGSN